MSRARAPHFCTFLNKTVRENFAWMQKARCGTMKVDGPIRADGKSHWSIEFKDRRPKGEALTKRPSPENLKTPSANVGRRTR